MKNRTRDGERDEEHTNFGLESQGDGEWIWDNDERNKKEKAHHVDVVDIEVTGASHGVFLP